MNDPQTGSPTRAVALTDHFARRGFELVAIALGTAAVLFLIWRASGGLFLVFAGLLFATFLDACTRGFGLIWNGARGWRLAAVCIVLAFLGVGGLSFGGYTIVQQADELVATVQDQLQALRSELGGHGPLQGEQTADAQSDTTISSFLPEPSTLLRSVTSALGGVTGVLGNLVVILFLGLYVAIDPEVYRSGTLLLLPRDKRQRVGAVLDETAGALRWWVVGQLVSMTIIAGLTFVALLLVGMPGAFILAVITGLFAFIPYIGSFVSGAIIVLVGLAQGGTMVVWAFGVYLLVQLVESYVISPMVERWSVSLSPALIIGGLTILGILFGIWGFILAAPLLAVLRIVVLRLWVEDALQDSKGAKAALEHS
ncbi:AI-2E family transporter [Microvirga massiliensis]|uniref:AI-2E family transporter n=1 Tax=Microvirga massiliensis TaxID=1033741 RepID=UPI00065FF12F|nr:AI-2E family transporter [Microvirga massiliensis]